MKKITRDKKGFTLLELMVVVVVVGINASLAIPQYTSFVEKARTAEAAYIMDAIKTAQSIYKLEMSAYSDKFADLPVRFPTDERGVYWRYELSNVTSGGYTITAIRTAKNAATGIAGRTIVLTWSDIDGGRWSGTHLSKPVNP